MFSSSCIISALVGFVAGAIIVYLALGAMDVENLTRDEEQKCLQHILKDCNIKAEDRQALVDELQLYAMDLKIDLNHLSPQLEAIIRTVIDKWQ